MEKEKKVKDVDFADSAVPASARKNVVTMFMIMLGFTFFSASMWVGQQLADGLDFWGFLGSLILGGIILGIYTGLLGYVGAKTGLSLDLLSQRAFGEKGSYLPSAMTSFTQIGWFGVGLAMFAIPVSKELLGGNDIFEVMVRLNLFYLAVLVLGLNIWTTNDNALYTAGLGLANIFHQRKKPMVLLSGIIGTVASVWLYYNFCGWLNILNCTLPPVGMILVLAYFMNKKDFETDQPKLKTVDWFAVAGVILGAIVANLLHWGIASINGMVVAAVCYCVGQAVNKRK